MFSVFWSISTNIGLQFSHIIEEVVATKEGALPFMRQSATSPVAGFVAAIGAGWILLETERTLTEIQAFINGIVTRTIPNRGVVIEADGATVQAQCGFGGEAHGRLRRMVDSPYEALTVDKIDESVSEAILLASSRLNLSPKEGPTLVEDAPSS